MALAAPPRRPFFARYLACGKWSLYCRRCLVPVGVLRSSRLEDQAQLHFDTWHADARPWPAQRERQAAR